MPTYTSHMEIWQNVPDLPEILVSTEGRVARLMISKPSKNGYVQHSFGFGGKRIRRYLHELMLTTFVGPRPPGLLGLHANDVRTDNRLENLRWGTRSANQLDALRNGGRAKTTHCPWNHPKQAPNLTGDGRCLACSRALARARQQGVTCTQEMRDAVYLEVIS